MTKAKASTVETLYTAPVILFGIDGRGKPKAARFRKDHAGLAVKAAGQLQLQVLANDNPTVAEIAARLPVGRVHATGRAFVPFIPRDLYDKLIAVASNGNGYQSAAASQSPSNPSGSTPNLPESWDKIGLGDLVVAQESPEDGWYVAIVIESNGDMFTLRWRDYPRERRFARHRHRIGLMYPSAKPGVEAEKSATTATAPKQSKSASGQNAPAAKTLPKHWSEISVGHLVLAASDGPSRDWWEAIPIEMTGDVLKLRWHGQADLAPVSRSRFGLALICPEAL
jgi:hypothetical protein